jgi:molybdate transport repressor ModE-like protein
MRAMDPRRLLVLREVSRAGSLAGAARTLGWTQPAVSQHIRRLERDCGSPLVVREGRGVVLTETAVALVRHGDAIADRLKAADEEVEALRDLRRGRVRLAAFPSASATLVPQALVSLARDHPGLDVLLTEVEPPEALQSLADGDIDLAVVFSYDQAGAQALFEERVLLVLPKGRRTPKGLSDLRDERWIAGCARCRGHLVDCAQRAGFVPDMRFETDDYVVAQELVAAGLGVTVLPELAFRAVRHKGIRTVALDELGTRTVQLVVRPGLEEVPAVRAAAQALRAAA